MNQPLLRFLATKNYKNLDIGKVELQKLNIFIGSNGSGKSNFISCLKFLKDCLNNVPDENRGISSFESAITKIGSDRILDNSVHSPSVVNFSYCFSGISQTSYKDRDSVILNLSLFVDRKKTKVSIHQESLYSYSKGLSISDENNFYYNFHEKKSGEGRIASYVFDDAKPEEIEFVQLQNIPINHLGLFFIPKILETRKFNITDYPVHSIRKDLVDFICKWRFYNSNNMDLHEIRMSEPKIGVSDIYLSLSGDNLALVLENLIQEDIDFEDDINQVMKSILPKTRRIKPIRSGRLSLTVAWYFEDSKEPFYLSEMSDGTVRMLCWATILHSPVLPSLLVIDEPELGLHVSWMRILADWIKQAARKTQVIITTHSPDLLDHFTDCLENVYCFYSEDKNHFSMKALSREMLSPSLDEGWELGDLYRVGDPNVGGWPW